MYARHDHTIWSVDTSVPSNLVDAIDAIASPHSPIDEQCQIRILVLVSRNPALILPTLRALYAIEARERHFLVRRCARCKALQHMSGVLERALAVQLDRARPTVPDGRTAIR